MLNKMKKWFLFEGNKNAKVDSRVTIYTYSLKSMYSEYGGHFNDAIPGDIVIAHVADLDHLAYTKLKKVKPTYIVFGAVRHFCYGDNDPFRNDGMLEIQWMPVLGRQY